MTKPEWPDSVNAERIAADTLELLRIPSPTGDTRQMADAYERMLREAGCEVARYEFYPGNPTLVAELKGGLPGKTVVFSGHMDTIPLDHEPPRIEGGRIYGRGACDMKGSLACIAEALRALGANREELRGTVAVVASSLHESPGGRGEDLYALAERAELRADAAVVMEGATLDLTIAQLGSATFEIAVRRDGEPGHQLHTPAGTPHPITAAADIVRRLDRINRRLERDYIEDTGYASYFVGSVHSGQFYNVFPNSATIVGVRRYRPETPFEEVERELRHTLDRVAQRHRVDIALDLQKVRDGYRIDRDDPAVAAMANAIRDIRGVEPPLVGKKLVTDAGIFASRFGMPAVCHGPDQRTAHGETEYVDIGELELAAKTYLRFVRIFSDGEVRQRGSIRG